VEEASEQFGGAEADQAGEEDDGSPEEVVLLLDGERPGGAEGTGKGCVTEVLEEKRVGKEGPPVGLVGECVAQEPGGNGVADDEQEEINGPDAEGAARVEVAEVVGFAAGFEEDGGDEEAGKSEG